MSPELMWLRSRAEDVNQRVQAFARANISRPGAGVGATRALSLLHAVCVQQKQKQQQQQEEGGMQVAPQALMYALGCIYGNLVRLVHANRERSAHCASVLAGIVLPACLQRTWTPAQTRLRTIPARTYAGGAHVTYIVSRTFGKPSVSPETCRRA